MTSSIEIIRCLFCTIFYDGVVFKRDSDVVEGVSHFPVKYLVFRNSRNIYICLSICSQSWYYMQLPDCFQVEVSTVNE